MHTKLPLNETNRIEVYFDGPSAKLNDLSKLDSLMNSSRAPALIISPNFLRDMNLIRMQRNSQYSLMASVDPEGKTYGGNKVYAIKDLIEADGFDIGLTANKDKVSLINEMKGIMSFLSQAPKHYFMRWSINTKHGSEHINNCIDAIVGSKINYDLVSLITDDLDPDLAHDTVKVCREKIGNARCRMKISGKPSGGLIREDHNLRYQINASELI